MMQSDDLNAMLEKRTMKLVNEVFRTLLVLLQIGLLAGCASSVPAIEPFVTPTEITIPTEIIGDDIESSKPPCTPDPLSNRITNTWVPIGPFGGNIRDIEIDPTNPDGLYVATFGGGIYNSEDGGDSWSAANTGLDFPNVTSLAIDPNNPQLLYAGANGLTGNDARVYVSRNGGKTWDVIADTRQGMDWLFNEVSSLVVIQGDLFMGSQAIYQYRQETWEQISEQFLGNGFIHLVADPNDPAVLYAGTYQGGLFRSGDSGQTWQPVAQDTFAGSGSVRIAVSPGNPDLLLASGPGVLLRSVDRGKSWSSIMGGDVEAVLFDPAMPNKAWLGTRKGLWFSQDAGRSWKSIAEFDGVFIRSLAVSPQTSDYVFVGTSHQGLFRSKDGGQTWENISNGIANTQISTIASNAEEPARLYSGTLGDGLYISNDRGITWQHAEEELGGAYVQAIAIHPTRLELVFVGTWDGLFISRNHGESWQRVEGVLDGKQIVAITSWEDSALVGTQGDGLYVSHDRGITWTKAEFPELYITSLFIDSISPQLILAGTLNGIFRSSDGGMNWQSASDGIRDLNIRSISADAATGAFYIASGDAIYVSQDKGLTWKRRSSELGFDYFRAVSAGDPLLTASWKGIFSSNPGRFGWTVYNNGLMNYRVTSLERVGNTIYAGTYGGGIYQYVLACNPLYGRVTDSSSGLPLYAQIRLEPGGYVTYSGKEGYYSFDYLAPGEYTLTAQGVDSTNDIQQHIDFRSLATLELNLSLQAGLPESFVPLAVTGCPKHPDKSVLDYPTLLSAESLPLTAHLLSPGMVENTTITWMSDQDGNLGTSVVDDKGASSIEVNLKALGGHQITASLLSEGRTLGSISVWCEVQDPGDLSAIGMAWDGASLWVTHEPAETGEIGRIYQLTVIDGHLAVLNSYPHPAPAPDSIAWDGQYLWTVGGEGPDPFRAWENGSSYLYEHSAENGPTVVRRIPLDKTIQAYFSGLTWDGRSFWGSNNMVIYHVELHNDEPIVLAQYHAPGNWIRTVEWVNGFLWAWDAENDTLYKLDPRNGLSVIGSCQPGTVGGYGIAWTGEGFWLFNTEENPHLRFFMLQGDCPQP